MSRSPARLCLTRMIGASLLLVASPADAAPSRILSLNLCADQLLIALADRGQIAGVTQLATDRAMSAAAAEARGLRPTRGDAEDVLAIAPDLILAAPGPDRRTVAPHAVVIVPPANSLEEIFAQIAKVAAAVGHPARGTALIARMRADLAQVRPVGSGAVAAYYQRRGYMTGAGTLVDEMMARLGLVNLAETLGKAPLARLSLEELVAARPDFLIVEADAARAADEGSAMLRHPALAGIPRLIVPEAWTVCGGPAYVRAVRTLAGQIVHQKRTRTPP